MSKTIAIAGLGWLGQPFAQRLMTLGYRVKGSVTSLKKASSFQNRGFNAFPLELSEQGISGEPKAFLKDVTILVCMIPPGLRRNTGADYVAKMKHFLGAIEASSVKKLVLVSSTSVYSDSQGHVFETNVPKPNSNAGLQLLEVEQLFFNAPSFKTTLVRFGGLYGGSREPVKYLAGRTELNGGAAPVNLIHRDDAIGILSEIIKQDAFGHIFNAVSPQHPLKKEYYTHRAKELQLEPPNFSEEIENSTYKKVDSKNLDLVLGYSFIHALN